MRQIRMLALASPLLVAGLVATPALADSWRGSYEVYGVKGEDMLKMREGPGVGYKVIVGLPNGTRVKVQNCQRLGNTRWCEVTLERARSLKGFVSESYLREK
ncbi:SH3 domain-containing protein [Thioclava sp.]|uniref:SH3 domain-containing protein n=1 Tax=Thioclava sp. TaxID=1933450 RepID=UPI003AA817D4